MSYYGHASAAEPSPGPSSSGNNNESSSGASRQPSQYEPTKIFVGGLAWSTVEESLQFYFSQFGPVTSVEVMRDRHTGDPRGFAFVVFENPETVDLVMDENDRNGHTINHKVVDVKRAQARGVAPQKAEGGRHGGPSSSSSERHNRRHTSSSSANDDGGGGGNGDDELTPEQKGNKIFVGGIPPDIDRDQLKEIFEQFGPVVEAIVMLDQVTKRSRCFGFVTYEDGSGGALKAEAAQPIPVQDRQVEVRLAIAKSEQRRPPPAAGSKHYGLRAGMSSGSATGPYAGLSVAYGRQGWKAGYGSYAFGKAGWGVEGWEDFNKKLPQRSGFSFKMINDEFWPLPNEGTNQPPTKKLKSDHQN